MIPSDDLSEDPAYYDRRFDADKAAERERAKAREALDATDETPLHGLKLLKRIIADTNESYSVRMDARRLLEVADMQPKQFPRELQDFLAWYSETK